MEGNRKPKDKLNLIYGQLIYNKGGKNIQWGKDSLFNIWCQKTGQLYAKESAGLLSHTIYKNQPKCIKNLNVRTETIKLL